MHVIFEFIRTLEYRARRSRDAEERPKYAMRSILELIEKAGIKVLPTTLEDVREALSIEIRGLNFGDKLCLAVMRRAGVGCILTADKAFNGVRDVKRLWLSVGDPTE